ncbi:MAG: hypothetical protein SPL47_02560 [Bacteroidales bacterium]|nr:hypothetical protein [Bacteroidales bacterium]
MGSDILNFVSDKEYVRRAIKNPASHTNLPEGLPSKQLLSYIDNPAMEFWKNFQEQGGLILRCNTSQERMSNIQKLAKSQQYNFVLSTHPNISKELEHLQINHLNAIPANSTVDAVVALSTTLVARNGSIGFTQPISRFLTLANIAKDVIVISRMRDIVPDIEDALVKNRKNAGEAGLEFLTPTHVAAQPDNDQRTAKNPRIILLLLSENEHKNQ